MSRLNVVAPNFLIIGPPKSGTGWVYEILQQDERFFLPQKECRYFSYFWREGPISAYYSEFVNPYGAIKRGEASPSYFVLPKAAIQEVGRRLREIKLIFLLRAPQTRAWAHARHNFQYREGWFIGRDFKSIEEVDVEDWRGAVLHPFARCYHDYAGTLSAWLEVFPAHQLLVVTLEQIAADPEQVLSRIYDFLQLDLPKAPFFDLEGRPNESPHLALPGEIETLITDLVGPQLDALTHLRNSLPKRLAEELDAAVCSWSSSKVNSKSWTTWKKPLWPRATRNNFPEEILEWSAGKLSPPPDLELLRMATLDFEYRQYRANGREDDATADVVAKTASSRGSVLERHQRLRSLESTLEERTNRLLALERDSHERFKRIQEIEQRLAQIESRLK